MQENQKVIRNIAIGCAIVLAIVIILGIVHFFGFIINIATGHDNELYKDFKVISENVDLESLYVDIDASILEFIDSDYFKVETNDPDTKVSVNNRKVEIRNNKKNKWFKFSNNSKILVYLPNDRMLKEVDINTGAGSSTFDNINAEKLTMDLGAGEVNIKGLNVYYDAVIKGGVGQININNGNINNLDLKLGVGQTNIDADITGKSSIKTGVGELNLDLGLRMSDYRIDIEKGLGLVNLNGSSVSEGSYGEGVNYIKINGGVGAINIKTVE